MEESVDTDISAADGDIASYMMQLAQYSLEMEISRTSSLTELASHLLTCNSILSIALITVAPNLYEFFSDYGKLLTVGMLLIFVPMLVSLLLALLSQIRIKYFAFMSPKDIGRFIAALDKRSLLETDNEIAIHYTKSVEAQFQSILKKNNIICSMLEWSIGLLVASIVFLVLVGGWFLRIAWPMLR